LRERGLNPLLTDPLGRLLRAAVRQTGDHMVRGWLRALLRNGEHGSRETAASRPAGGGRANRTTDRPW
jgi:hypothetical protein